MENKDKFDLEFSAGSLEIFDKFVSDIKETDSVVLVTHTDLDGITSGRVVKDVISQKNNVKLIRFVGYDEVNSDFVEELRKSGVNKVIFTDLAIDNISVIKSISEFAEILLIDHHLFNKDFNSDKIRFINIQGHCAGYICYKLFSRFDDEGILNKLDWLVACSCISDWLYFNNQNFMMEVFSKYGDKFEIIGDKTDFGGIRKSGKFWDLQWKLSLSLIYFKSDVSKVFDEIGLDFGDVGELEKYAKLVEDELNENLIRFEKEKEEFGDIYFWELKDSKYSSRSLVSTLSAVRHNDKFVLIIMEKGDKYIASGRRQDKKKNVKELLENLLSGFEESFAGGHTAAGGGHFLVKDLDKFKERLREYSSNN